MRSRPLFILGILAAAAPLFAQSPGLSPIFPLNSYTTGAQQQPAVAMDPSGGFVTVWESFGQDGSARGVFGQRFDALGAKVGNEFQANSYATGDQRFPQVASDSNGNFVVVWDGQREGDTQGIALRAYDSDGVALFPGEREAHTGTADPETLPRVARNDNGFVVVWHSTVPVVGYELRGQLFEPDTDPTGATFQVAAYTTADIQSPSIDMDAAGNFVVAWQSYDDGSATGIRARAYASNGVPITGEIDVNSYTTGFQRRPSVAMDGTGGFVVAWDNGENPPFSIHAQKFDATGAPVGGNVLLGQGTDVVISKRELGGYGAVWVPASSTSVLLALIEGARFDDDLAPVGGPFDLHDLAVSTQPFARTVAADNGRHFVFAWQDLGPGGDVDVFARRGGHPDVTAFTVDERASGGSSNLNGVLETGERVVVDPAYLNLSGAPYPLSGAASNFTGPAGPIYTIHDASADYGTLPAQAASSAAGGSASVDCFTASGNCLEFELVGARPAGTPHWDATYDEALSEGVSVTRTLHVGGSFADVPGSSLFFRFVENLFHNGITAGGACGGYCPTDGVKRQQMAVFLLKSRYGSSYAPPTGTGTVFTDVPLSNPFVHWIEDLYARGITGGCSGGPPPAPISYCPDAIVNRQQMAVFLLKTLEGSGYTPPAATGIFQDVPLSNPFVAWIEELYARQVTGGCAANPLQYCPANPTNRQQMAAFLVKTFGLVLYGP